MKSLRIWHNLQGVPYLGSPCLRAAERTTLRSKAVEETKSFISFMVVVFFFFFLFFVLVAEHSGSFTTELHPQSLAWNV